MTEIILVIYQCAKFWFWWSKSWYLCFGHFKCINRIYLVWFYL